MSRNMAALLTALHAAKNTVRTGWMLRGVPPALAETIAAHLAESAIIALVVADSMRRQCGAAVSPERAAIVALVHDLSEGFIGDIVKRAVNLIGKDRKEQAELHVAREEFGEDSIIYNLLREYVEQGSEEARVAKYSERLSTLIQGLRYARNGYPVEEIVCSMYNALSASSDDGYDCLKITINTLFEDVIKEAGELCALHGEKTAPSEDKEEYPKDTNYTNRRI